MRIVFLDIDGVLNNQLWYESTKGICRERDDLDPKNIEQLNNLIKATGAKVVVTSVWRLGRSVAELQAILDGNGFEGEVIGTTLDLRYKEHGACILRGNEIYCWIQEHEDLIGEKSHEYKRYVILDDDSDMLYWQRNNFIHVDPYCGLTPNIIFHAEKILNQ
jgi:HAD domain in Swiss Army Knife RNA repair proteins